MTAYIHKPCNCGAKGLIYHLLGSRILESINRTVALIVSKKKNTLENIISKNFSTFLFAYKLVKIQYIKRKEGKRKKENN